MAYDSYYRASYIIGQKHMQYDCSDIRCSKQPSLHAPLIHNSHLKYRQHRVSCPTGTFFLDLHAFNSSKGVGF